MPLDCIGKGLPVLGLWRVGECGWITARGTWPNLGIFLKSGVSYAWETFERKILVSYSGSLFKVLDELRLCFRYRPFCIDIF